MSTANWANGARSMSEPIEYICIKSGHSVILQRKDRPEIAVEAGNEDLAWQMMATVQPGRIHKYHPLVQPQEATP